MASVKQTPSAGGVYTPSNDTSEKASVDNKDTQDWSAAMTAKQDRQAAQNLAVFIEAQASQTEVKRGKTLIDGLNSLT